MESRDNETHWFRKLQRRLGAVADPRILLPSIAVVLLAVIWIATYSLIQIEYSNAQRSGAVSCREFLHTYAAQVVRALEQIDQTLKIVRYASERVDDSALIAELDSRALLPSAYLFTVRVTDRTGKVIANTGRTETGNVSADEYFKDQMPDDMDAMSIGRPTQASAIEHELRFSRRLTAPDGSFAGIALVSVDAAYFVSGYDEKLGHEGVLALLGSNGVFLAKRTGDVTTFGDVTDYSSVESVQEAKNEEAHIAVSPWDGVTRFISSRELYGLPLTVVVGLSVPEQLASARASARQYTQRATFGSVMVVLLATLLGRMASQLARSRVRESEAKIEHARRVEYLAYHDGLTALPNRSLFSKLLGQGIAQAHRHNRQLAVAFLDLDRFKQINDTLGHDAGDELLREVAVRLKACVRESDTVARLGGDEFVVLLLELGEPHYAATVARKILLAIAMPFTLLKQEFRVTASIGICTYPQDGQDEQTLTKNADIAMYQAKEEGKNNFQFYSKELNANSLERLTLESSLRHALERGEFQLHYQAKRDIASGQITGMEALLRWEHPELGTVAPMKFIPVAEETGLIVPIGKWILMTACQQNVKWQRAGLPRLNIAVNLTARQFADEDLQQNIAAVLEATGMDATLLELELSEDVVIRDVEKAISVLTRLRSMGIKIAIDDFGSGYSSLATLQRFPLDTIKIDSRFIHGIADRHSDEDLTDAVIAMGRALSLTVVAQGVETREQADFLRSHSCNELQGFYFARPLPANQATQLLAAQTPDATYVGSRALLQKSL